MTIGTRALHGNYSRHNQLYRKFSEISAALGISATIINVQNNYLGISPTLDPSKDLFHQKSATK